MSFSNEIKKELSNLKIESKIQALLELSSILKTNASISIRNAFINIVFFTESEHVVKRLYKLIDFVYNYEPVISRVENNSIMKNGLFSITVEDESIVNKIISDSGFDIYGNYNTDLNILISRICNSKKNISAYFRGIFLGSGSMVDPHKNYHLEIKFSNEDDKKLFKKILEIEEIKALYNKRKEKHIVYFKNSEDISTFLYIIKAQKSMLELENVKVEKDLKNDINRKMNFDMANINKTIETSSEQIKSIEFLESIDSLPDEFKELAEYRKKYPEYTLKQLGESLSIPETKSTVAYKLNKIKKLAKIKKNT